ncbi:MAG TPA: hypothetical protein VKY74_13205 [Chloroflexia bacterium]|nr:hypothetical protein [Chloroflexia bacterium]
MRLCLAFMFQDEEPWLRLHLPVLLTGPFAGIVALDGGSRDGSAAYVRSLGGTVVTRPFDGDFGAQGNCLIAACEQRGYESLLRTDPDELWWPADLQRIAAALDTYHVVQVRRHNFVRDRRQVNPAWYPDWQGRAWRLHQGLRYSTRIHETLNFVELGLRLGTGDAPGEVGFLDQVHIYHYGWIEDLATRALRYYNYERRAAGQPAVARYPPDAPPITYPPSVPFAGPQPLDPDVIGTRAPFPPAPVGGPS